MALEIAATGGEPRVKAEYWMLWNGVASAAAIALGVCTMLYMRKSDGGSSAFAAAGTAAVSYLAAAALTLLYYFLVTGKFPTFGPADAGLVPAAMTVALAAICIFLLADAAHGYWRLRGRLPYARAFLPVIEIPVLLLFFARLRTLWLAPEEADEGTYVLTFSIAFLAMNALVFLCVNQARSEEQKQEMAQTRQKAELEHLYFERARSSRQEIAELQSEYDALLVQAHLLLESRQTDAAKRVLSDLAAKVEATGERKFCGIAAVNAIMEAKTAECDRHCLALDAQLLLPDSLRIKDLDLCMAIGNLLDNAIRECRKAPGGLHESPSIFLAGRVVQGYLVLRCENPLFSSPQQEPEGTGYGLKILKDIARRYQGDFFTEKTAGKYISQLSLPCVIEGVTSNASSGM